MDEREFERRAAQALRKLDDALRDAEGVESDLAGDILTLEFEDGSRFVVNSHSAAKQIWLSANLQAWHFGWHEPTGSWRDTRSGAELYTELGKLVSEKLAQPVIIPPPN
jgi:CyaY protein